jgi:hypothetical protein
MDTPDAFDRLTSSLFSFTAIPLVNQLVVTLALALLSVVVGEFTISIGYRINRKHLRKLNARWNDLQRLSHQALEAGDKASYRALNKEGNDVHGRLFFQKVALSAASLWPIFFALAWLQEHQPRAQTPLPGTSYEVNYVVLFLICYIVARVLFGKVRGRLPYFSRVQRMVTEDTGHPSPSPPPS